MAEFSFLENDQNMEMISQFSELNPISNMNFHNIFGFATENFMLQRQSEYIANSGQNLLSSHSCDEKNQFQALSDSVPLVAEGNQPNQDGKRKMMDMGESSSQVSEDSGSRKNNSGKGKRSRGNEEGDEKLKEVVHVRARRGQATDSHSLAERVRRGKINEKLKCLQGIVPGCYKTMGMAVMLDEIINYVQSLQNQVEFLSMKLTAASRYHDFSLETNVMEAMLKAKAYEEQKAQRILGEGFNQGLTNSTQIGSFDLTFGTYPSLPYTT